MYLLGTEFAKLTRPWKAGKPMEVFTCVSMGMSLDPTQTISLNTRQWRLDWKTKMKEKKHLNENNELFVMCGRKLDLPLFCHYPFKLLNHNWNYHLLLCNSSMCHSGSFPQQYLFNLTFVCLFPWHHFHRANPAQWEFCTLSASYVTPPPLTRIWDTGTKHHRSASSSDILIPYRKVKKKSYWR